MLFNLCKLVFYLNENKNVNYLLIYFKHAEILF